MEAYQTSDKIKEQEFTEEERSKEIEDTREEALKQFRLSPAYPIIIEMIDDKIKDVTDTRILAKSFGKIKSEVIGELGTLGIASLMASAPLEELKEDIGWDFKSDNDLLAQLRAYRYQ